MNPNILLILKYYLKFTRREALELLEKDLSDSFKKEVYDFITRLTEEDYTWVSLLGREIESLKQVEPSPIKEDEKIDLPLDDE